MVAEVRKAFLEHQVVFFRDQKLEAGQLTLLRRWFADWQSPVPELLEATEPEDLVPQPAEELHPLPAQFANPTLGVRLNFEYR